MSTPADHLLPMVGATTDAADRLTLIAYIRDVVNKLLKLSNERMAARSTRIAPIFFAGRSCVSFDERVTRPFTKMQTP